MKEEERRATTATAGALSVFVVRPLCRAFLFSLPLFFSLNLHHPPSQRSFPPELLHFRFHATTRRRRATPPGAEERAREKEKRAETRVEGWPCVRSSAGRKEQKKKKRRGKTRAEACNRSLRSLSLSSPPLSHLHPFSPNALLFLLHFNAPEMRRVGIHRRRETEGAIVEQRGRESRENEEERKKGGDGSFFFDAALGACLLGLLAFFSTRSLSIASRRASASLSSPKLAYLSDADTRVGRYGGEEDRLRGGGGSGRLFRGVLLLLLLRSGLRCGFSASAEESRKEALQGAGSGHLFRVPVNLKRSSAFLTRKSEMRTASERERERARAFIEWGRCLSSEEEEKEEEAKSEKKKNSRGKKKTRKEKKNSTFLPLQSASAESTREAFSISLRWTSRPLRRRRC